MTTTDAWARLAQCRRNQPGMQVIVAADIIDTLLERDRGGECSQPGGHRWAMGTDNCVNCGQSYDDLNYLGPILAARHERSGDDKEAA